MGWGLQGMQVLPCEGPELNGVKLGPPAFEAQP